MLFIAPKGAPAAQMVMAILAGIVVALIVSPNGGLGNIKGVVAAVILQLLSSALNMFESISNFYRDIIWGLALIAMRELKKQRK